LARTADPRRVQVSFGRRGTGEALVRVLARAEGSLAHVVRSPVPAVVDDPQRGSGHPAAEGKACIPGNGHKAPHTSAAVNSIIVDWNLFMVLRCVLCS